MDAINFSAFINENFIKMYAAVFFVLPQFL